MLIINSRQSSDDNAVSKKITHRTPSAKTIGVALCRPALPVRRNCTKGCVRLATWSGEDTTTQTEEVACKSKRVKPLAQRKGRGVRHPQHRHRGHRWAHLPGSAHSPAVMSRRQSTTNAPTGAGTSTKYWANDSSISPFSAKPAHPHSQGRVACRYAGRQAGSRKGGIRHRRIIPPSRQMEWTRPNRAFAQR